MVLHRYAYSVSGVFALFCLGPGVNKQSAKIGKSLIDIRSSKTL